MKPEPLDRQLRIALEAPAQDVARTVREALVGTVRSGVRTIAILVCAATGLVLGISYFLLRRNAAPVLRIENVGQIVLLEDRANRYVSLSGGDRSRDHTRSTSPRILITQGDRP